MDILNNIMSQTDVLIFEKCKHDYSQLKFPIYKYPYGNRCSHFINFFPDQTKPYCILLQSNMPFPILDTDADKNEMKKHYFGIDFTHMSPVVNEQCTNVQNEDEKCSFVDILEFINSICALYATRLQKSKENPFLMYTDMKEFEYKLELLQDFIDKNKL